MNIWIVNHYAMPPKYETRIRTNTLAKYFQEMGHTVRIFSASTLHNTDINLMEDKNNIFEEKNYDGLDFVHIKTSNYSGNSYSRVINMLQFPVRLYRVAKKIKPSPDVIICDLGAIFAAFPYWVSKYHKSQFLLEVRDLWPESIIEYKKLSRKNPLVKLMYGLEKWIYKKSDKIVFTMEGGKDYIEDKGWHKQIDLDKVYHVNNGVDLDVFNFNKENFQTSDQLLQDKTTFKVMYTGSIRQANNVKEIVEAAKVIQERGFKNVIFLIYGEGSDKKPLEKYCIENGINNVVFKGSVEKNRIPFILSKGDLNILHFEQNSLKKYGGSLNKMFEYFASGKPTVSDCRFGYDLIERYKSGLVDDGASSEKLANLIIKFYEMPQEEYEVYCENALLAAEDYNYRLLSKKLEDIIVD